MPKSNWARTPCCLVRYWNAGATNPCAISGLAAPSRSSMSRVGGWKVDARDSSLRSRPASNTVTGTPLRTRLAAATRPTGPAPAISTRSSMAMLLRMGSCKVTRAALAPLLDRLNAGLGDDVTPFHGFGRHEFCEFLRTHDHRLCALLGELLPQRRILERGGELLVQFGDNRLWRSFRRQQHEPAGVDIVLHPG